ncbi:tRNA dihydrouridine(20/20a) synthase DusA [Planctobacterium marinum]|uniref:tRNA dihydrouridine(20/20a) synthase DusA n=1 Tax=Planctobacterium marinum TaxID=1631968 RepID=UPI001E3B1B4F|nr:tRNA dihydrouridine(20/20a) synthase DusA [Planctobacterium marinum]MCC2607900.1 tRNA dihydrouridine(20/20a) synthase DusA [Planctobacterium marinum]
MANTDINTARKFSVAPMLDWTDRHCRYFYRLMSQNVLLYTEMVTTGAIIHGKGDYLGFNSEEHPVALQLGGSEAKDMAYCAERAQQLGYDEVNINVGCPSDRVKNGSFGACLMAEPDVVAASISTMQAAVDIPVTVKSRIGIDDMDEYEDLTRFIHIVAEAGCQHFIVHARKAWLQGLSPKENREIPPLKYERVYQLKQEFPDLHISINGGIKTLEDVHNHLQYTDGVMMGREVYSNPWILTQVESELFAQTAELTREAVVQQMMPYVERHIASGGRAWHVIRHMLGIFQGQPASRVWRRHLSENAIKPGTQASVLTDALDAMLSTRAKLKTREEYLA